MLKGGTLSFLSPLCPAACLAQRFSRGKIVTLQLAELAGSRSIGAFSRVEYLRRSSSPSAIRKSGSFETTRDVSVGCWWVNHSQTFRHEFEGGYIGSPKRKRDGSRNRYTTSCGR